LVAAAVALAVDLWLTGFLHFDGLADSADGLLPPHSDPERRLDVMARPDVGAFGVTAVVLVLITRWAAFVQLDPSGAAIMAVALLWGISRLAMAVLVMTDGYVRPGGLAQAFSGARRLPVGVSAVAFLAVLPVVAAAIDRDMATPAGGFALAAFVAVVVLAHRRIGGFTGDVVGAAGVVAETVGLAVLAAP
jgi:adenosylcobinamide-GDP ribazoletransferase